MYLWSVDLDAVIVALSCFGLLCEEAEIRSGSDELTVSFILPNYHLYQELAQASSTITTANSESRYCFYEHTQGRVALQKNIMGLLRKLEHCANGVQPAWEETFRNWEITSKMLQNYPKGGKAEDGQAETFHRSVGKRRASSCHQSSEHDLEEWSNMTWFLLALGGVCLQRPRAIRPIQGQNMALGSLVQSTSSISSSSSGRGSMMIASVSGTLPGQQDSIQYCPVTQFIGQLLRLLVCNNEKFGPQIQKHVKELVGNEMSSQLYPILFDQIRAIVEKFFDQQGQVVVTDINTQFIEHTIFIMKSVLEGRQGKDEQTPNEHLGVTSIEGMMLAIVRYVRHLDMTVHAIQIKTKLCQLVEVLMKRRDDLAFRQEMKFRNKLVEYLTDWVMGTSHQIAPPSSGDVTIITRDLDQACMACVGALLKGLPLQPEESDRGDLMDAKSALFLKYFTLFMNLLNDCVDIEPEKEASNPPTMMRPRVAATKLTALRNSTIQAMSNLLSANIDSGLMHSIDLGYNPDLQTRAAFMEVLTQILQQGTEFDTLAETVLADRFEQLVQLVTMISDKGELPIAMALANVVTTSQMDELARVLVTLFDSKHLLSPMLWNIFYREVEVSDCMQTLFRGNSLGSKIMAFCFKIYGASYLQALLEPLIRPLIDEPNINNFEVDPARLDQTTDDIDANRKNLIALTKKVFDAIVNSADKFPSQLRSMCHCLYQVLSKRFPNLLQQNIGAVGTVIFLRFINPAIVSPQELGIVTKQVQSNVKRGLMLLSKILQNIANHVEFSKEQHMLYFNDFLRAHFEPCRRFFIQIASDCETVDQTSSHSMSFISDANVLAVHRRKLSHHCTYLVIQYIQYFLSGFVGVIQSMILSFSWCNIGFLSVHSPLEPSRTDRRLLVKLNDSETCWTTAF